MICPWQELRHFITLQCHVGESCNPHPSPPLKDLDPPILTAAHALAVGSGASALHPCWGFTPRASTNTKHGVLLQRAVVLHESGF